MALSKKQCELILWVLSKIPAFKVEDICDYFEIYPGYYYRAVKRIDTMDWYDRQRLISGHTKPDLLSVGGPNDLDKYRIRVR